MPRTLILHVGPAKTGTSAIQAILRDAPPDGLTYPQTGQWPDGAHHKLTFAMRGKSRRGDIGIPPFSSLLPDLVTELNDAQGDVVLSSESFAAADLQEFLDHLKAGGMRAFDDIRIVVVLRHPLERAASAYNQNIKDMAVPAVQMPKPYLETSGKNLLLTPLVRTWLATGLPISFLSYHPSATLVERFFDCIGHTPSATAQTGKTYNRSINGYATLTLLAGRMAGLRPEDLKTLFRDLRQEKSINIWKGPSFPFARNTCEAFLDTHVAPDLAEVTRLTGLTLPDKSTDIPKRFQISDQEQTDIRDRVASYPLTEAQKSQLDRVLAAFAMQNRKADDQN